MDRHESAALDAFITGNYGEDYSREPFEQQCDHCGRTVDGATVDEVVSADATLTSGERIEFWCAACRAPAPKPAMHPELAAALRQLAHVLEHAEEACNARMLNPTAADAEAASARPDRLRGGLSGHAAWI